MATYKGIGFPLDSSGEQGWMLIKTDSDLINDSILQILMTRKGERVMLPEFGSGLRELLFEPMTAENQQLIAYEIYNAIEIWEPRIEIDEINIMQSESADEQGEAKIEVRYQMISTGEAGSLNFSYDNRRLINVS